MLRFSKLILSLFLGILVIACKEKEPERKPNVILILTDDQGYGDLGIHGNEWVETPNLDRLASESARFDRFYVSPLCAPTRASLLTGRYHLRTGVVSVSNGLETMDADEYTLAEYLKDQGYRTGIFGKWHNGQHYPNHPLAQGFEEFTGFTAGHWSNYFNTHLEKNGVEQEFEGYLPDVLTEAAMDFIRRNKDNQFFTYLSLNTPHSPHQVPDSYFLPYKEKGLSDELAAVYGMVTNLDWNVGRLMTLLQELNLEENTLIIFLTDNGPNGQRFNAGMKGVKGSVHEGGIRVPSFWRWKGKINPGVISTPAAHIDVFPTLVEIIGEIELSGKKQDGRSLLPLFKGEILEPRSFFTHVAQLDKVLKDRPAAIRRDTMMMALLPSGVELYDLKNDPQQEQDLSSVFPELVSELNREYQVWWDDVIQGISMVRPIPISSVGSQIFLPGYEAELRGGLRFFEGHGWAQDWVTDWKLETDSLIWNIDVLSPGEYEVWLEYSSLESQLGSEFYLTGQEQNLFRLLDQSFVPDRIPSPDRVPRKEAPEQTWGKIQLGDINLSKNTNKLILTAKNIPPSGVADVFSLRLIPKN